jgi:TPR repeat protein
MSYRDTADEPDLARFERAYRIRKSDPAIAIDEWKALASEGSVLSMINLGAAYYRGRSVKADDVEAEKYYQQGADAGALIGSYCLGRLFLKQHRYADALGAFKYASGKGYPSAAHYLGRMYCLGIGVPKDVPRGEKWLEFAAKKGNVAAKAFLGNVLVRDLMHPRRVLRGLWLLLAAFVEVFQVFYDEGEGSERFL